MIIIECFQENLPFFYVSVFIFGLLVGSFLNVVIYRLPVMMEREWKRECIEFLGRESSVDNIVDSSENSEQKDVFSLVVPRSRCPKCGKLITALENIPVISYIMLRGKCGGCGNKISIRYPLIELFSAILSVVVAYKFGVSGTFVATLILTYSLISLALIDFDTQYLPDDIILPLLWGGMLLSLTEYSIVKSPGEAIIGAVAGYMSLWLFSYAFKKIRKKDGMGNGDFKLFAVFGAWFGWESLPSIIVLSSFVGAVIGITVLTLQKKDSDTQIPFGPYLAAAAFIYLNFDKAINSYYLDKLISPQ